MKASSLLRRILLAATLVGVCAPSMLSAQRTLVPGTTVTMEPPPGFIPNEHPVGFRHPATGSSILVSRVTASVDLLRRGMTAQQFAGIGAELIGSESIVVDRRDAVLFHTRGKDNSTGVPALRSTLYLSDRQGSHMILATYPAALADSLGGLVRRAILSARVVDGSRDPFEGLSYRLDPGDSLKPLPRITDDLLMLRPGGAAVPPEPGGPSYLVWTGTSPVGVDSLKLYAGLVVRRISSVENLRNLRESVLRVDGLDAYEIVADATDRKSGTPVKVYQVMALEGRKLYLLQGLVGAGRAAEYLPEFRRLTGSFRRVPAKP
ncbi:MAG TPA: hypothetical protein VF263_18960 [Longimicrobiaceae bacterium]